MNEEEIGVEIVNANQVFIPDGEGSSLFVDEKFDEEKEKGAGVPGKDGEEGKGDDDSKVEDLILDTKDDKKPESVHIDDNDVKFEDSAASGAMDYKQSILALSRMGIIDEVTEDSEFAGEDGEVTKFSELEIDNEELYQDYIKALYEEKQKKALENHVDLKGVSDFTKQIIEIDKAGGNVSAVLQAKAEALDPISGLDLSQEGDQKAMVEHYLSTRYKEMSREDIQALIKTYEDRGILEEKAANCKEALEKAVSDYMEAEKTKAEERKHQFLEQFKVYKKSFKESVSSKFQVKEEYARKLVDFATKLNNQNIPENLHKKFFDMLNNADSASELALFLYDKEEYVRQKTNKVVSEERRTVFRKLTTKSKKDSTDTSKIIKGKADEDDKFLDIKEKIVF